MTCRVRGASVATTPLSVRVVAKTAGEFAHSAVELNPVLVLGPGLWSPYQERCGASLPTALHTGRTNRVTEVFRGSLVEDGLT